jgi:hypothetical protein
MLQGTGIWFKGLKASKTDKSTVKTILECSLTSIFSISAYVLGFKKAKIDADFLSFKVIPKTMLKVNVGKP